MTKRSGIEKYYAEKDSIQFSLLFQHAFSSAPSSQGKSAQTATSGADLLIYGPTVDEEGTRFSKTLSLRPFNQKCLLVSFL